MKSSATLAGSALAVCLLAACSSTGTATQPKSSGTGTKSPAAAAKAGPSASPGASPATTSKAVITIKGFEFSGPGRVAPGQQITVHNADSEAHTVTADSGSAFDVVVAPSATVTLTAPGKAGSYKYHCTYHGNMRGTLLVS